ncbi:MAG: 50S ribosomal protein L29 [Patescibacteria group bacterium]
MKAQQWRTKSPKELGDELTRAAQKLRQLRFEASFNKLKNMNEIGQTKRDIARIKTLLKEK